MCSNHIAVVEIRVRNWWTVFYEDRTFCRLLIAFPLKMYSEFGRPKCILGPNAEIGGKMANGLLLFLALQISHWPKVYIVLLSY